MQRIAGVFLMSVMLMLAACGGGTPTTRTYTSANNGQTITLPATVSNLTLLSGQGGTGQPQDTVFVRRYTDKRTNYNQRNDLGGDVIVTDGGTTTKSGATPADYCTEKSPYILNGVVNYSWECHDYTDTSYFTNTPATTGGTTSMTGPNGFNRSWAGGTGGPATASSTTNVPVTGGGQYALNIPFGGSITISYYE